MLKSRVVPVLVLLLLLSSGLPAVEFENLEDEVQTKHVPANLQNYNLYLDEAGDSGGDGAITTTEPDGANKEASIMQTCWASAHAAAPPISRRPRPRSAQ